MKPDPRFVNLPKAFWAHVRTISEVVGYTERKTSKIKIPSLDDICQAWKKQGLDCKHLVNPDPTKLARTLLSYFAFRAQALNEYVEPRLMDAKRAKHEYDRLYAKYSPKCPLPLNKQKGPKRAPAYLTGIVNILIEAHSKGQECDFCPRRLTTVSRDGAPLRTFARWVDGAFPSAMNPIAIWEIKEYYYTTTFGSRVADGIYETLLDGMEVEELREHEGIDVRHYLMVDAHYTWWECGRSYLCRILDILHMGYVHEALFGHEVIERLPGIVKEWGSLLRTGFPAQ
jgi:hypothetical protein